MVRATWNGQVIADSDEYEEVEGNIYFPPDAVNDEFLHPSDKTSTCPWKGEAHYYDIVVDDDVNDNAAWYYPEPKDDASHIKDHVAFYGSVDVA
jgi:uncharacterized protein (DUF427 family)